MTTSGPRTWKHPVDVLNGIHGWEGETGALLVWARWTIDSLHYLEDLDTQHVMPSPVGVHEWQIIDLAHIRWAAMSAMTAIDLCAAALGRRLQIGPQVLKNGSTRELNLTDLKKELKKHQTSGAPRLWVDQVLADNDVRLLLAVRDPMVHARLNRHFKRGGTESERTFVLIDGFGEQETGRFVQLACITATRVVEDFLDQIVAGVY